LIRERAVLTIIFSQFIAMIASPARAGEPSASDLIALAPVIRSSEERYRSIELAGYFKDKDGVAVMKFRAIYRSPNRHALIISDGSDGTPLLFASNNSMIVYDPVRPVVLDAADTRTNFSIWQEGDRFWLTWEWSSGEEKPNSILLDVRSMFTGRSKRNDVVKIGDGKYRLTNTSERGSRLISHIDTNLKQPYTRIELVMEPHDEPAVCPPRWTDDIPADAIP
jgi:hypothetical protein